MSDTIIAAPTDSQVVCNGCHYKLGRHGLVFKWNAASGWRNSTGAATKVVEMLKKQGPVKATSEVVALDPLAAACPRLTKGGVWHRVTDMDKFAADHGVPVDALFKLLSGSIKELDGFEWGGAESKDPRARYMYYFTIKGAIVPVFNLTKFAKAVDVEVTALRTFVRTGKHPSRMLADAGAAYIRRDLISPTERTVAVQPKIARPPRCHWWVASVGSTEFYIQNLAAFARGIGVNYTHLVGYANGGRAVPPTLVQLGMEVLRRDTRSEDERMGYE